MIRLLTWDEDVRLRFEEYHSEDQLPPYAILSHTWLFDNAEEVTFDDLEVGSGFDKAGYAKLVFCRQQAQSDNLQYMWIDTCCINRHSEPELSEAINSMFTWYECSTKCYVYLTDVDSKYTESDWRTAFARSRWHSRGWTLQELIAPQVVEFYAHDGSLLGDKDSLGTLISHITGISGTALRGQPLSEVSVDIKLSWTRSRTTKREEDHVYSLFGIFDVSMPLIYGEGKEKAFRRLYEQINMYCKYKYAYQTYAKLP
jgi:hypothetical protein